MKFGATLKSSRLLLEQAKELGLDIVGVSFHVDSGCTDPQMYAQAIADAHCIFDMGKPKPDERMYLCSIWSPTCNDLDCIMELCTLPDR
ncbi:hypothetical protein PGIGA_G00015060 [Pangasianodon gigas]|uniref:Uncharacterized protein n=1 Tax=Pangasianodon gigas TaxID=30993 RepID=A0ACC5WTN9_PANGG|nr:hypothetical protein [Pangasianodon gigas]